MWQVIGHERAVAHLQRALSGRGLPQSLLLTGPARIGKTHVALQLAAAVNCAHEGRPCGACLSCRKTLARTHPDVTVVEPEGAYIKIGQIRDLEYNLALSPMEGARRVCIITEFDKATDEAANAFLKTLEEPPASAMIVIAALDEGLLLPTIVSRCQVLALQAVPDKTIAAALVQRGVADEATAQAIARLAAGRVGWAMEAATSPGVLAARRRRIEELMGLLQADRAGLLASAEDLSKSSDLADTLRLWQSWWRDVALVAAGCGALVTNAEAMPTISDVARRCRLEGARQALRATESTLQALDRNANARLALDVLFLGWRQLLAA